MRAAPLTTIKGGINRLRTKGGARADTLYDLVNGYVTEAGTVIARPGTTREATLDPLTRGLTSFQGSLHTYCHVVVTVPDGFTLNVLVHPDGSEQTGYEIALEKIHFAEPFMGALYVVAEFEDGAIYHYWLQGGAAWEADTIYASGALIEPTVPNGIVYKATRDSNPNPSWAAGVPRYDGTDMTYQQSVIEPTTYNDYYYVCVLAQGTNPRSGTTEPTWPTTEGELVTEVTDSGEVSTGAPTTSAPTSTPTLDQTTIDRYLRGGFGSPTGIQP